MPELDLSLSSSLGIWIYAIAVIAAFAHGTLGFGFPLISTPVIAMLTDIRTAILVTVIPNIAVNLVSIIRGGNWSVSLGKFWPVAFYGVLGTVIGTKLLIVADPEPFKLLLALMILAYLRQNAIGKLDWPWIKQRPGQSGLVFGLAAGFLGGTVNIALPALIIYFMAQGLAPTAMTQVLNLCFLASKTTQAAIFGLSGEIGFGALLATAPLTLVSLAALFLGIQIQKLIHPEFYLKLLKKTLLVVALVLIFQVVKHYLS